MKNRTFILLLSLLLFSQEHLGQSQGVEVDIYKDGERTQRLTIDSITVEETEVPVIPGKNIAIVIKEVGKSHNTLLINGIERKIIGNDNEEQNPTFVGAYANDFWVVTERNIYNADYLNRSCWTTQYSVWKNMQYEYTMSDPTLNCPVSVNISVDDGGLYLYGYTQTVHDIMMPSSDGYYYLPDEYFYYKYGNLIEVIATPYGSSSGIFDIYKGNAFFVSDKTTVTDYQSTERAFNRNSSFVMCSWNGTSFTDLQQADLSKIYHPYDAKVYNGKLHVVGHVYTARSKEEIETGQITSAVHYNGETTEEWSDYIDAIKINIDNKGNVYTICYPRFTYTNHDGTIDLLKNGEKMCKLCDGTHSWAGTLCDTPIIFDDDDVYVIIPVEYTGEDDILHYYTQIWKNGEVFWTSPEGLHIKSMVIF